MDSKKTVGNDPCVVPKNPDPVGNDPCVVPQNTNDVPQDSEATEQPAQPEIDLEQQITELKDKLLRNMAEFDNYKKRAVKEREELFTFAVCETVAVFLPVLDNLDRAVASGEASEDTALLEGIKMVQKQFSDTLTAIGVTAIPAAGEKFDPDLHNAVMHVEDENLGEGVVAEELAKGYMFKDRVIRHSMVKTAN